MPGTFSPAFFLSGRTMRELSIFVDESGSDGPSDRHYLLIVSYIDGSCEPGAIPAHRVFAAQQRIYGNIVDMHLIMGR